MKKNILPEVPPGMGMSNANNPESTIHFTAVELKRKNKENNAKQNYKSKSERQNILGQAEF